MKLLAGYRANRLFTPNNRWKRRWWRAFFVCMCVCVCVRRDQCRHSTRGFGGETELLKWLFPRGYTSLQIYRTTTFRARDGEKPWAMTIRGIVQPQMKILSSFNYPHVVPNLCRFMFSCGAQNKIFWKMYWLLFSRRLQWIATGLFKLQKGDKAS